MVINEESNLVENVQEECECKFTVDEAGEPIVLCPDTEFQKRAVLAMEKHDVTVRVTPVLIESDTEDEMGQDSDEVEEPEEDLETGFTDDDDDDDDDGDDEE